MIKKIIFTLATLSLAVYPILVYVGLHHFSPRYLVFLTLFPLLIRYFFIKKSQDISKTRSVFFVTVAGLVFCLLAYILNNPFFIKLYPVVISFTLFAVFFHSLLYPPTIITLIAEKISPPPLSAKAITYTQHVTFAWCLFFFLNGLIALVTATKASLEIWTLYNGLISYMIIGLLILIELLIRSVVKKRF